MVNPYLEQKKKDQKLGLLIGTLTPVLFSPVTAYILYSYQPPKTSDGFQMLFWEFYSLLFSDSVKLTTFISLCALVNLPVFFILLQKKKDFIAKGIIYSTIAYAFLFFSIKFLK